MVEYNQEEQVSVTNANILLIKGNINTTRFLITNVDPALTLWISKGSTARVGYGTPLYPGETLQEPDLGSNKVWKGDISGILSGLGPALIPVARTIEVD
jgi:hypothetical protein